MILNSYQSVIGQIIIEAAKTQQGIDSILRPCDGETLFRVKF